MKHKWHKEIKAWADGELIEVKQTLSGNWLITSHPEWNESYEYRIRPKQQKSLDEIISELEKDSRFNKLMKKERKRLLSLKETQYLYVYHQEGKGLEIGYAPHEALNMWKTKIVGKIKLEQDDE